MAGDSDNKSSKSDKEISVTVSKCLQDIGKYIFDYRKSLGLKQGKFAKRVGVDKNTVKKLEESGNVSLKTFVKVLHALGKTDSLDAFKLPDAVSQSMSESKEIRDAKKTNNKSSNVTLKKKRTYFSK